MKKPVHRAIRLEDALITLQEAERLLAELEPSDVFQALTRWQKLEYRDVLGKVRDLIHNLEQDHAQEQIAC